MLRFSFFVFFYFFCYFALLFSQNVSAAGGRSGLRCPPGFELEGIDCIKEIAEHPHYHCPHGFHFLSPKEGCILKETYNSVSICPNDATLDKKEDVCVYIISSTPTATCMAGYELNANKKCARRVAVTGRVECAANFKLIYEKNGTPHPTPKCIQQRFSSPEPICPSGYEMEGSGGRRQCVSEERVEAKLMCPNDYFMYGENGCIKHLESPPSAKCESGYIYDGKDCVRYSEMPAAPTCKIGTFDGSECLDETFATPELICPEGYTLDISTDRCYTIKEAEPRRVCPSSFDIEVTKIEIKPSKNTGDQVHAQSTTAKSSSPHPPSSSSSSHATGSPHGSVAFHNGNNNSPSYIRQKHIVSKSNDANHYKNTAAASASPPPQPPASSTGNASASVPYKIPLRMLAGPLDYQQARNPYYNYNDNNNNNNNNYNTNHYNYRQQQQTDNNNNNFASARPLVHNVGPYDAHSHPPAHAPHIAAAPPPPPPPPHSPPHSPPPHSPPSPPPHKSPAVSSPVPKVIFPSSPPAVQHQCRRRNIHSPEYRCPQDSQILEEGGEKKCRRTHKVPPTLVCPDNADATSEGKCLIRNKKDSIFVCPDGFVVNPTTKQCHRSTMPPQFNHCDKGVFDGGKCVEALESPPVYKCPQNSVYDKMTNSCYTIEETLPKLICGAEATLTPRNGGSTCLAKKILPTKQTCPPGTKWHSSVSKGGSQHYRQLETANGNKDNIPVKRNNGVKRNLQEVGPLHVPMHTSAEEADHDDLHEGDSGTCVKVTTARPDVVCKEGFVMLPEREDICYMTIAVPSEEANDGEDELGGRRRRGNGNGRQVQPTRLPANIPLPASRQSDYIPTTRPNGYIPLPPPPRNGYTSSPNPSRSGYMPSPPPSPPPPPRNGNIPLLDDASSSLAIDTGGGGAGGGEIAPDVAGGGLPPTPPPEGGIRNAAGRASGASAGRASGASAGRASGASAGRASGASAGRTFGGSVGRTSGASAGGTARLRLYNVETFDYRNYPKPDDLDDDGYYEVGGADR